MHGNISQNGYGNAIIGRYGGCFEEDIRRFMCDASDYVVGVVLGKRVDKKLNLIQYASKTLDSAQRNYATTVKDF